MDDTPDPGGAPRPGSSEPAAQILAPALAVIAAVAANGVIGAGAGMPWHIPGDLRHFRALTMGHRVVMGRRTWESIGHALPGRENVIVSRDTSLSAPDCIVVRSLDEALDAGLAHVALPLPVFCIGGAKLYAAALPRADRLYLTEIDAAFDGDTSMPPIDYSDWRQLSRVAETDPKTGLHYAFVEYARVI